MKQEKIFGFILMGILDALLIAAIVVVLVMKPSQGETVTAQESTDFMENADTYYQGTLTYEATTDISSENSEATLPSQSGSRTTPTVTPIVTPTATPTPTPGSSSSGSTSSDPTDELIFPNSSTVLLSDADIRQNITTEEECQQAINEIYARGGYIFTKQENRTFFGQFSWYHPTTSDMNAVTTSFTATQKANVDKLLAYQSSHSWQ